MVRMSEIYQNVVKCFAYLSMIIELSKGREITGYDVLVHVRKFGFEVSAGTVYHHLAMLEKDGLIERKTRMRAKAKKRVYRMTEKGMKVFMEFKEKWRKPLRYAFESFVSEKET